jgi:hypothetical protein
MYCDVSEYTASTPLSPEPIEYFIEPLAPVVVKNVHILPLFQDIGYSIL